MGCPVCEEHGAGCAHGEFEVDRDAPGTTLEDAILFLLVGLLIIAALGLR
jgi:hypothetical protein